MTREAQRQVVAEARGWKWEWRTINGKKIQRACLRSPVHLIQHEAMPNYPQDLNACHEVENWLTHAQHKRFRAILADVMEDWRVPQIVSATAAERTLALVHLFERYDAAK